MKTLHTTLATAGLAVMLLVACSGSGSDNDAQDSAATGGGSIAEEVSVADRAASEAGETSASNADSESGGARAPTGDTAEPQEQLSDRKVILTSELEMEVADVPGVFRDVQAEARSRGGYVESSRLEYEEADDGEKQPNYATVTVRVPAERHEDFLSSLRGMPSSAVTSETSDSQEVTDQYTDLQSQLRNLERIESQYLTLLDKAVSIDDILTVSDRLDSVRAQIERTQGRINLLDNLTDLATVTVTIVPAVPGSGGADDGGTSPKTVFLDAWDASLETAEKLLYGAIVVGVALIWLLPVAVVAGLVRLGWRRRVHSERPGQASDAGSAG
jgi:hypothetical protein